MDSRERTLTALNFQRGDRIPIDLWLSGGMEKKMGLTTPIARKLFFDTYDVDLRYIDGPQYVGPSLRTFGDGSSEDIWGVRRQTAAVATAGGVEVYKEVIGSPLASATTLEEIESYDHWPSADWFDFTDIEEQCTRIRDERRVVVFVGDRLNRIAQLKPGMYLRGIQRMFEDMILHPEFATAIFSRIRTFYLDYARRLFEAANGKLDIVLTGDDFGAQNNLLVSPRMWETFLGQGFADYVRLAKNHGIRVMHHTCGAVYPLIPLMIERGLDILQSLQPDAVGMDPHQLKCEFGRQLAFHGGISVQSTLPFGGVEDVRKEVKDRVEAYGVGGGYILCTAHNIQADTPVENVIELLRAYHKYGSYR